MLSHRASSLGVSSLKSVKLAQCSLQGIEKPIKIYQYEICPYCAKLKGLLDFHQVPYVTIEVNPLTKQELKDVSFFQRKVPFAVFPDGSAVGDSSVIIQSLRDRGVFPATPNGYREWEDWVNRRLAVLLFPNMTRSLGESWETFSYISNTSFGVFDKFLNRVVGSVAMNLARRRLKFKYSIVNERSELLSLLGHWMTSIESSAMHSQGSIEQERLFYGGTSPNDVDAMVFSVIRAMKGTESHRWLLRTAEPPFLRWWTYMEYAVGDQHHMRIAKF